MSQARSGSDTRGCAQRIAALGLRRGLERERHVGRERMRELVEPARITGLELELDLVHGRAQHRLAVVGAHLADVDAKLGHRAVGKRTAARRCA